MKEYLEKSSKILDELQTTEQGLSEAEAARRLSEHGPNRRFSRPQSLEKTEDQ